MKLIDEKARGVTTPSSPCVWEANIRRGSPSVVARRSWSDDPRPLLQYGEKYHQRYLPNEDCTTMKPTTEELPGSTTEEARWSPDIDIPQTDANTTAPAWQRTIYSAMTAMATRSKLRMPLQKKQDGLLT